MSTKDVNKKVLLRERKRHTARHVASARYASLSTIQTWSGGTLGTPRPDLGWGTSPPTQTSCVNARGILPAT